MSSPLIEKVLACPNLPSLPAVAIEVLDLTRTPDVPIKKIAEVVQNDQALTAKILRTVNSSYYGLSKPCPTISRAVSYLGLNTVKSLVLGFSLVDCFSPRGDEQGQFDLIGHWRRAVYGAAGSRLFACETRVCDPDEAFIAAMLQDVGMLAAYITIRKPYVEMLETGPECHEEIAEHERHVLGFDHTRLGSMLGQRWRLPESYIETIRHHHTPERAGGEHAGMVRCVALARLATELLAPHPADNAQSQLLIAGKNWLGLPPDRLKPLLAQLVRGAAELSKLFQLDTGAKPSIDTILMEANDELVRHQVNLSRRQEVLEQQSITDALTGARNRGHFDDRVNTAFEETRAGGEPVSVLFLDADRFKPVNDTYGHQAGDLILIELATRLQNTVSDAGVVCRYGGEEFAVVLCGSSPEDAGRIAESIRSAVEATPFDVRQADCGIDEIPVTVSVGVATFAPGDPSHAARFDTADQLVQAADRGVYVAKEAGRNRVCRGDALPPESANSSPTHNPVDPAPARAISSSRLSARIQHHAPSPARSIKHELADEKPATPAVSFPAQSFSSTSADVLRVLVIEDDFMHAALIQAPLQRVKGLEVTVCSSGEAAIELLQTPLASPPHFDLVLCDLGLPGISGIEVLQQLRSDPRLCTMPIVVLTASDSPENAQECLQAGANAFIPKSRLADDPPRRVLQIAQFWCLARAA